MYSVPVGTAWNILPFYSIHIKSLTGFLISIADMFLSGNYFSGIPISTLFCNLIPVNNYSVLLNIKPLSATLTIGQIMIPMIFLQPHVG